MGFFVGNEYIFLDLEQKLVKYFGKGWKRGSEMVSQFGSVLFRTKILLKVTKSELVLSLLTIKYCRSHSFYSYEYNTT